MADNTYTWTCPRCRFALTSGSPSAPDNCPRCNYPDAAVTPIGDDPNEELEAEVGPEAALLEGVDAPVAAVASTLIERARTEPQGIDRGWLAECIREEVVPYLDGLQSRAIEHVMENRDAVMGDLINFETLDWVGAADAVVDRYEGPRPTLICGCPAGYHPKSMDAIAAAHPERLS